MEEYLQMQTDFYCKNDIAELKLIVGFERLKMLFHKRGN